MTARDRNADGTEFFYPGDQPDMPVNTYACYNQTRWPGAVKIVAGNPPVMELGKAEAFAQAILDAVAFARHKPPESEATPFRVKSTQEVYHLPHPLNEDLSLCQVPGWLRCSHETYHLPHPLNEDLSLCGIRFDTFSVPLSARQVLTSARLWGCPNCRVMSERLADVWEFPAWPSTESVIQASATQLTWEAFTTVLWRNLHTSGSADNYLFTDTAERKRLHAAAAVAYERWRGGELDALKARLERAPQVKEES